MKEAIGTSFVFNLMMIFVGVIIVILISSIAYTKGFKIRNRIIDRIEANNGYTTEAQEDIDSDLKAIGYKIVKGEVDCKVRNNVVALSTGYNSYNYCVYEYGTNKGNYYGVTVFISVDIPLIGNQINIPIYGETRVIYDKGTVKN